MSDEDQAGAKEGLVQQEVVMGVENKIGEEPGLMDTQQQVCLLYTSPSPRDQRGSRMPSSA